MPATDHSRHFDGLPMISGLPPEADVVTGRAACLEDTNSGSRQFGHRVKSSDQKVRLSTQFLSSPIHARVISGKSGTPVPKTVLGKRTRLRRFSGAHSPLSPQGPWH